MLDIGFQIPPAYLLNVVNSIRLCCLKEASNSSQRVSDCANSKVTPVLTAQVGLNTLLSGDIPGMQSVQYLLETVSAVSTFPILSGMQIGLMNPTSGLISGVKAGMMR
jgi:hypothetical protein